MREGVNQVPLNSSVCHGSHLIPWQMVDPRHTAPRCFKRVMTGVMAVIHGATRKVKEMGDTAKKNYGKTFCTYSLLFGPECSLASWFSELVFHTYAITKFSREEGGGEKDLFPSCITGRDAVVLGWGDSSSSNSFHWTPQPVLLGVFLA